MCNEWGALCIVPIPTYDGSGQIVHPDLAVFSPAWHEHLAWLAMTPYRGGNPSYENPSIVADGERAPWVVPDGVTNPLVPAPSNGHYSDPDLVYNPAADELWYYFRSTIGGRDEVRLMRSRDGVSWSTPQTVAGAEGIAIVSPTVVRGDDGRWTMWSVSAVQGGCQARSTRVERRTSTDGIHWSAPSDVAMAQPGYAVWHLDIQYVPSRREYWAVYVGYPSETGCAVDDLFFGRSSDGVHWQTYPTPLIAHGAVPAFKDAVYRSTFQYDATNDVIRLWVSGTAFVNNAWVWALATSQWRMADLVAHVSAPATRAELRTVAPMVWDARSARTSAENFP
jgi:hypothetical protein